MNLDIRVVRDAGFELENAIRWYELQKPGLGFRFHAAVLATIESLQSHPESGSQADGEEVRRLLVAGFPYQVIYRLDRDQVQVVAFAHTHRSPGYWKGRR